MIIELRRHGKYDEKTGELTPESKEEAKHLSENKKYKIVFSAAPFRCQETAEFVGKKKPIVSGAFNDLKPGEDIRKRTQGIVLVLNSISSINASDEILVFTHSNLIAAIEYLISEKEIPQNLDDLPVIPHFGGIKIEISKQKI